MPNTPERRIVELDYDEKIDVKKDYLKLISNIGYKVTFDLDKEINDDIYDLQLLLTRVKEDAEDPNTKKRYVTYCISNGSALNFIEYRKFMWSKNREKAAEFSKGVRNRCIEYTLDDIAALLLHRGFHISEFYQFVQGKGRLVLNRKIARTIIHELNFKGSPLENQYMRNKRIAERAK